MQSSQKKTTKMLGGGGYTALLCLGFFYFLFCNSHSALAATTSSITQRGITWTFDGDYTYGQFANGDYWVLGPVTITSITPTFTGSLHGFEVNPTISAQGFDSAIPGFNSSLVPTLPYTATYSQSIVKVISREGSDRDTGCGNSAHGSDRQCIKNASVLTVLMSAPSDDGATWFRPPYLGTDKTLRYSTDDLDYDLLPSLAPTASAPSYAWVIDKFSGPYLDHLHFIDDQYLHANDYMPAYSADYSNQIANGALVLSIGSLTPEKKQAVNAFVQVGIDEYGEILGGRKWRGPSTGGHGNGRVLPVTYAAALFDNQDMIHTLQTASNDTFAESGMLYWSEPSGSDRRVLFGESSSEGDYWELVATGNGFRTAKDPYATIDGGAYPGSLYQGCCDSMPWKGTALGLQLLPEASKVWASERLLRYVNRWVDVGAWAQPDTCAPYDGNMADYGITFGPNGSGGCIQDTNPDDGIGRFPDRQGYFQDDGGYQSTFVNQMWDAYRNESGDILPPLISDGSPEGELASSTTSVTLSVETDESATCRYSTSSSALFDAMTPFTTTGGTSHEEDISGLTPDNSYNYYVKCQDSLGNTNLDNYVISFSINNAFDLEDGNILHFTFDNADASGATITDLSPQGNNGHLANEAFLTAGKVNEAVSLDGINSPQDYVALQSAAAVAPTASITLAAWVKNNSVTPSGIQTIIGRGNSDKTTENASIFHLVSENGLRFLISDGTNNYTKSVTISDWTQWHYVVGVFNAATGFVGLYVDGVLVSSGTTAITTLNPSTSGMQTRIGAEGRNAVRRYWDGLIDDTRVWDRALSSSEVTTLYNSMLPDTTDPDVSMTGPEDGATVSGTFVILTADASDDTGVSGVQFKYDTNTDIGAEDTAAPYIAVWNSTAVADGSHSITAVARDAAGNQTTSAPINIIVDNTGPLLSTIQSNVSSTSAVVSWSTNEDATSQVEYGLTSSYGFSNDVDLDALGTSHSVLIPSLSPGTIYHWRIISEDAQGNETVGGDNIFTTDTDAVSSPTPTPPAAAVPIAFLTGQNVSAHPAATSVHPSGTLITYVGDPRVYLIENGSKRWIPSVAAFNSLGYAWTSIVTIPTSEAYPDGASKTASPAGHASFTTPLYQGLSGSPVTLLQETLKSLGFFPPSTPTTTYFGSITKGAVQAFQRAYHLATPTDPGWGYVGPRTREILNTLGM